MTRGQTSQNEVGRVGVAGVISWGAFLACSWTWCIGMFLPVLLLRDFGPLSFAVFAIPNVVGAVLMGALLARPGASEEMVGRHGKACWAFSFVTLAFQVFFLCWLILGMEGTVSRWVLAPALLVILFTGRGDVAGPWTRVMAMMVLAGSLAAATWWLGHVPVTAGQLMPARLGTKNLVWLAPVCAFGFGLCPYLDLTFHTARQKVPGWAGTSAFMLGFSVFFLVMILMTVLYAVPLLSQPVMSAQPGLLAAPILVHVSVQLVFTIMLHKGWIEAEPSPAGPKAPANASLLALVAGVVAAICSYRIHGVGGLAGPEVVYRGFMAFYGLVFPAYVWLCMICGRAGSGPGARQLLVFAGAVCVAGPMYWLGFIEGQTIWLGPGFFVVLAAGAVSREGAREPVGG
jgi:hypothetical protein